MRKILIRDFYLLDLEQIPFVKGTYKMFGFRATITLLSPLANLILNWKYLSYDLVFPKSWLEKERRKDIRIVSSNNEEA